jgi:hypothetical protein
VLEAAREFGGFSRVWDSPGTFFYVSFVPGVHRLLHQFCDKPLLPHDIAIWLNKKNAQSTTVWAVLIMTIYADVNEKMMVTQQCHLKVGHR